MMSDGGAVESEGSAPLTGMSGAIAVARQVVALVAASDVALLRIQTPPLPAAKLRAALPNLVETQLLGEPSDCVVVAGGMSDGLRTVAVVRRDWLELLTGTLTAFGARRIAAWPAQSCLPVQPRRQDKPGGVIAAVGGQDDCIDVMLRFPGQEGFGLAIAPDPNLAGGRAPHETAAREVVQALDALAPGVPITLHVPQAALRAYREASGSAAAQRIEVLADDWPRWVGAARGAALDLTARLGAGRGAGMDWKAWRWPLGLAAAVLVINAAALNIDWWRMKGEADSLRADMVRMYRSAYPKETVIIDPAAQMRQRIALARRDAGLPAPDDFAAISTAFGEAWSGIAAGKAAPAVAAIEYRERSLFVRFNPGGEAPMQRMKAALAARNLSLEPVSAQPAAVWRIRSAR